MITVTDNFKNKFKEQVSTNKLGKIIINGTVPVEITKNDDLVSFEIEDNIYDTNSKSLIGNAIAKKVTAKIINSGSYNLENKEIEVKIGTKYLVDDEYVEEYISYGNFIVNKITVDQVSQITTIEAYDYMIKFNKPYADTITYPCTLLELLQDICIQVGIDLVNLDFPNSDFTVENNQFVNGESCRDILKAIVSMAGGNGKITTDNLLYIKYIINNDTVQEIIDKNQYSNIKINDKFTSVNRVVLKNSQVEGENVTMQDDDDIALNGVNEIAISDNPFAYTQEKRETLITAIFNSIKYYNYVPIELEYYGYPYLDSGDRITAKDINNNSLDTNIFNHTIIFNGSVSGKISTPALTKSETQYLFIPPVKQILKNAQIKVDKALGEITSVVEEQSSQSSKISTIEQNVSNITSSVTEVENLTDVNTAEIETVKERTNVLEESVEGLTNTMKETGGLNILHDAPAYFTIAGISDYWINTVITLINTEILDNTRSDIAFYVQNGTIYQTVAVQNGTYTLNGLYKKLLSLSNLKVTVNDVDIPLTALSWDKFVYTFEVTNRSITIKITGDSANCGYVADLMLNSGDLPQVFSLNQNETYTDAVKIGKGLTIEATNTNSRFEAGATGIVIRNKVTDEVKTEFTDQGIDTKYIESESSLSAGLLTQNINGQVCMNNIGGV